MSKNCENGIKIYLNPNLFDMVQNKILKEIAPGDTQIIFLSTTY